MTTRLESEVTRETSTLVRDRLLNVTLIPADPSKGAPDLIELHLKGTQQRKKIPLAVLCEVWPTPTKIEKQESGIQPLTKPEYDALMLALAPFKEAA